MNRGFRGGRGWELMIVLGNRFTDDSFPLKLGELEVEQQRKMKVSDVEIAKHLSEMRVIECRDHFRISNNQTIDKHIGNEHANELPLIIHLKLLLTFNLVATGKQLNQQSSL